MTRAAVGAIDPDEVVRFAQALVRAPSENPGSTEHASAAVATDILAALGAEPFTIESDEGRPNVIATIGSGTGPKLAWNGHLDVVPAGDAAGWPHPPFEAVVEGGRLWGRGSVDMKGAVASALAAIAAIRRAGVELAGTLALHLVADEEHMGLHGTRVLLERGLLDADACVVGEPNGLQLGLAERGSAWITAVSRGRAAHGSTPHLGVNAITQMSRFLLALDEVVAGTQEHPLVGRPTVNVALIRGGNAPNVVPELCTVDIDRRTIPGEIVAGVLEPFEQLLAKLRAEHEDFDVDINLREWTEAAETEATAPFVDVVRRAIAAERGTTPSEAGLTGVTDARFYLNQAKIPTVVCGPGDLRVAHTSNECVEIEELVTAARIYARLFVHVLGSRPL